MRARGRSPLVSSCSPWVSSHSGGVCGTVTAVEVGVVLSFLVRIGKHVVGMVDDAEGLVGTAWPVRVLQER